VVTLAVTLGALVIGVPPAAAHGGPVSASAGASPAGPLQAVVTLNGATWIGDGDPASGLTVSATATGPGSAGPVPLAETSEGNYRGTMTFPTGGFYNISVSWSGNGSVAGAAPTSVTVESAPPPPTAAPPSGGGSSGGGSTGGGSTGGGDTGGGSGGTATTPTPTSETPGETPTGTPVATVTPSAASGQPVVLVPRRAARGAYVYMSLAVPNPSAVADVTAVTVKLPPGILGATTRALQGWRTTVQRAAGTSTNATASVTSITWTADGVALRPGEFQTFSVLVGPLPKQGRRAAFPVTVTLSDGTAQTWGETAPALRLTRVTKGSASAHG
jgi:uncharacterized protein YcnI